MWDGVNAPYWSMMTFPRNWEHRKLLYPGQYLFQEYRDHWGNDMWYMQRPCGAVADSLKVINLPKEVQLWMLLQDS